MPNTTGFQGSATLGIITALRAICPPLVSSLYIPLLMKCSRISLRHPEPLHDPIGEWYPIGIHDTEAVEHFQPLLGTLVHFHGAMGLSEDAISSSTRSLIVHIALMQISEHPLEAIHISEEAQGSTFRRAPATAPDTATGIVSTSQEAMSVTTESTECLG